MGNRENEGKCRPASPAQARSSATLTCCRPRAWAVALAAAAASLVAVALARRLRPPPPRSLSLPPPPGLMRDPRFLLRRLRPGKGAPGPQKTPRSSPAAATPPLLPTGELRGPLSRGYAASCSESDPKEEPREAQLPAAVIVGFVEMKRKSEAAAESERPGR